VKTGTADYGLWTGICLHQFVLWFPEVTSRSRLSYLLVHLV